MEERACQLALYLIENRATVRAAAGKFGVSKSTVQKHRPQGHLGAAAPIQRGSVQPGEGGAGGKQGPAAHTGRPGHPAEVQGRIAFFAAGPGGPAAKTWPHRKKQEEIKPPESQRVFIHKLKLLDSLTIGRYNVGKCWNWEQR